MINRAIEAEKKMKRLRMARYSEDLFDEIVIEMMKAKRTLMEMMAELDVEDEEIL
jgi:ribosome recycling factor